MGAINAHFAEALPISILIDAERIIKRIIKGIRPSPEADNKFAPLTAIITPRFVHLK